MSQNSQGAFSLATAIAIGVFLVAFACLWTLGDFGFFPAGFLAAVIAAIAWIVLFLGFNRSNLDEGVMASKPVAAPAAQAAAPAAAAAASDPAHEPSAEAAEAKRLADEQAAERAVAEEERRQAEEEHAEAKRKADEAAAAEAKRLEEQAAAERKASEEAAAASAETTPDYDGDGVREGVNEGVRPEGLDGPRDGKADDLKQIKGIGAKMEALCNRLGFWHFDQIAAWSSDEVAWVDANLEGFKGRVTRDAWVEQARVLAGGGETEFSKRVEDGDVY